MTPDDPAAPRWTIRVELSDLDCLALLRGEVPGCVGEQLRAEIRASLKHCREQGLDWLNVDDCGKPLGGHDSLPRDCVSSVADPAIVPSNAVSGVASGT